MNLTYDIEIDVSGKEHRGKTTLIAYLSKVLSSSGVELIVQRADPQIDDKLNMTLDQLREKLAGKRVFLRELHDRV
jgi:CO dehydrogenase nickel-insertion accessory protein CooC1